MEQTEMTEAPRKRGPGRPRLPRERIVATALELVDEQGSEALSLRALAQRLGSSTATLYRHFSSRSDLVGHVLDSLFAPSSLTLPATTGNWQDDSRRLATEMFETLLRHPGAATLLLEQMPAGPHAMKFRDRGLQVLLDAGFDPKSALRTYASLSRFVLGFAIQIGSPAAHQKAGDAAAIAGINALDPAEIPAIMTVAEHFPVPLDEEFEFGLDLLLVGLSASLEQLRQS